MRSAVTQWVNSIEAEKVNIHEHLQMRTSGQLRNLGSLFHVKQVQNSARQRQLDTKTDQEQTSDFFQYTRHHRIGTHTLCQKVG